MKVGERVVAIGSALSQAGSVLTTGIVSRLEADTLIADLNVNSGSSGGPLLNLNGEVVGLCTFFVKAPAGPGLAGIVRAHVARPILAAAAASLTLESPPFEALPVPSPIPYPADALREKAAGIRSPGAYGTTVRGMRIDALTPPIVLFEAHQTEIRQAQQNAEARGRGAPGEPFRNRYAWQAYTGHVEAIIGVRAVPDVIDLADNEIDEEVEVRRTTPSAIGRRVRFTGDVRKIQLLRNGVEVVPIVPGRFCRNAADASPRQPAGCFGLYQYAPSAFAPGAELELRVHSEDAPTRPRVWKIPASVVSRVWADFAPWLAVAACPAPVRCGSTAPAVAESWVPLPLLLVRHKLQPNPRGVSDQSYAVRPSGHLHPLLTSDHDSPRPAKQDRWLTRLINVQPASRLESPGSPFAPKSPDSSNAP